MKIKVSFRLERSLYRELRETGEELGWSFSEVLRYLLAVSYSLLRPDVKINADELLYYVIDEVDESGQIACWKVVRFLAPRAVRKIEEIERQRREA